VNEYINNDFDFHIIGASFAGSSIARELLKKNKSVLLIDYSEPGSRLKCAGGIEMHAFQHANLDIPFEKCMRGILSLDGELFEKKIDYAVVDRRTLDKASCDKAISEGAKFAKAKYLSHNEAGKTLEILIEGKKEKVKFNNLILANGFSHTKKNIFLEPYSIAKVEIVKGVSPQPGSLMFIFESGEMNGYYWIFPLPDGKLNIGAGSVTDFKHIDSKFQEFKKKFLLNGEIIARGGGIIPLYPSLFPQNENGSVTKFGNAAGMVQPLTGEGLKYISRISQIFADSMAKGDPINLKWLLSEPFFKIMLGTLLLRLCFCGGNSGMRLYVSLAKFATHFSDWKKIIQNDSLRKL